MEEFVAECPDCLYPANSDGIMVAGVPLGTEKFMKAVLDSKIGDVLSETKQVLTMLR